MEQEELSSTRTVREDKETQCTARVRSVYTPRDVMPSHYLELRVRERRLTYLLPSPVSASELERMIDCGVAALSTDEPNVSNGAPAGSPLLHTAWYRTCQQHTTMACGVELFQPRVLTQVHPNNCGFHALFNAVYAIRLVRAQEQESALRDPGAFNTFFARALCLLQENQARPRPPRLVPYPL